MSRRKIIWIVMAVVIVHAGLFLLFGQMRALPKARYIPRPNFGYKEEVYEDPKTGDKTIYREIRVSTKLADPAKLKQYEKQAQEQREKEKNREAPKKEGE